MAKVTVSANKLENAAVTFISLVDKGANRIPFRIIKKNKESQMGIDLAKLFKTPAKKQEAVVKSFGLFVEKAETLVAVKDALVAAGFEVEQTQDDAEAQVFAAKQGGMKCPEGMDKAKWDGMSDEEKKAYMAKKEADEATAKAEAEAAQKAADEKAAKEAADKAAAEAAEAAKKAEQEAAEKAAADAASQAQKNEDALAPVTAALATLTEQMGAIAKAVAAVGEKVSAVEKSGESLAAKIAAVEVVAKAAEGAVKGTVVAAPPAADQGEGVRKTEGDLRTGGVNDTAFQTGVRKQVLGFTRVGKALGR
jgi:colicin import membrane protein